MESPCSVCLLTRLCLQSCSLVQSLSTFNTRRQVTVTHEAWTLNVKFLPFMPYVSLSYFLLPWPLSSMLLLAECDGTCDSIKFKLSVTSTIFFFPVSIFVLFLPLAEVSFWDWDIFPHSIFYKLLQTCPWITFLWSCAIFPSRERGRSTWFFFFFENKKLMNVKM
jgi:hypothetical protein